MEIRRFKTAIVGCGMISRTYAEFLRSSLQVIDLVACSDMDDARAKALAETYGLEAVDFDTLLGREDIEIAINLTSPAAHYPVTSRLLEAGKHVYSEKMLGISFEEGLGLCLLARAKGLRLGVAPDTFLGGGLQTARRALDMGLIGQPTSALVSINRDYAITGDILPHLLKKGGSVAFDVGCYFLTALAALLGPAVTVTGLGAIHNPRRKMMRLDRPNFLEETVAEEENVLMGGVQYQNGVLGSVHFTSESIVDGLFHLEVYGTEGIMQLGDPNCFDGEVRVKRMGGEAFVFPLSHGFTCNARGLGTAEMAWAIAGGRPHRASMEMGCHVLEMVHGMLRSAREGRAYRMTTTFERPAPLPGGYMGEGEWAPTGETALV